MRKAVLVGATAAAVMMLLSASALASAGKGVLFHDGTIIRTVVVPVSIPDQGTDPFYVVTNGTSDQLGIAGVAPGDGPYHGGAWEVFTVTFNSGVTSYLLTSDEAVFAAEAAGDVTVARNGASDFRCPVQP
jgi:hypothetical protein